MCSVCVVLLVCSWCVSVQCKGVWSKWDERAHLALRCAASAQVSGVRILRVQCNAPGSRVAAKRKREGGTKKERRGRDRGETDRRFTGDKRQEIAIWIGSEWYSCVLNCWCVCCSRARFTTSTAHGESAVRASRHRSLGCSSLAVCGVFHAHRCAEWYVPALSILGWVLCFYVVFSLPVDVSMSTVRRAFVCVWACALVCVCDLCVCCVCVLGVCA